MKDCAIAVRILAWKFHKEDEAAKIVGDMKEQVAASWCDTVRACGVSESDAEIIRGAFVYEGFSF